MKGGIIKGFLLICVCLSILLIVYSTRRPSSREVLVERKPTTATTLTEPTLEQPSSPPLPCNDTEPVVPDPWNVFDAQHSKKFTIIVQTYKRDDLLKRFLKHYHRVSFPQLDQILVIWNNIGVPLTESTFYHEGPQVVPVKFIVPKLNTVRNKLQPYPQIQTTAVLMVDDDLLIGASDVEFAFKVWQQFPQRIVGFVPRKHVFEPDGTISYGDYNWKRGVPNCYSVVLTGASFIHKGYLKMFNESVSPEIHSMIDQSLNCEDLAMNVMVGDYLSGIGKPQPTGLFVAHKIPIQYVASQARSGYRGLSELPNHRRERFDCLKKLNDTYHGLPLPFTNLVISKIKS